MDHKLTTPTLVKTLSSQQVIKKESEKKEPQKPVPVLKKEPSK